MQAHYPVSVWRHLVSSQEKRKEICGSSHLLLDLVLKFISRCSILEAGLGADDEEHLESTTFLIFLSSSHWDKTLAARISAKPSNISLQCFTSEIKAAFHINYKNKTRFCVFRKPSPAVQESFWCMGIQSGRETVFICLFL